MLYVSCSLAIILMMFARVAHSLKNAKSIRSCVVRHSFYFSESLSARRMLITSCCLLKFVCELCFNVGVIGGFSIVFH